MTLFDRLQSHKGSLIHIKTHLYWNNSIAKYDNYLDRICLILDVSQAKNISAETCTNIDSLSTMSTLREDSASICILLNNKPMWVWVADTDVEVINETG
jgi:hypothetical protein